MLLFSKHITPPRRAAATVEFAMVAPLLFTLVFSAIDCGRVMMALDVIANASRDGARTGTLPGKANSDVTAAVNAQVSAAGLSGATTSVTVGGTSADVSTANQGDQIAVTVTVSYSSVGWLPTSWLFGGTNLSQTTVMRHE